MTDDAQHRQTPDLEGRTFILCGGYLGGALAGAWLGLVAAFVLGVAPSDPPRFLGEDLVAALVAASVLVVLVALVRRVDGRGRAAALGLLFAASFAALDVLCSLYLLAPPLDVLCVLPPEEGPSARFDATLVALQEELPPWCRSTPPVTTSPAFWAAVAPATLVATLLCSAAIRRSALLQFVGLLVGSLFALTGLLLSLARAFA
ncbi:hypothetical protein [Rubrobacter radiotolerans]|uniref:Uncharacterized protein n=1 Tax=Rubrobacter radiotolerans TaxID=42256 RepID=A0AB35TBD3_RUBRA|nr:hypothetical protein [Rubrobacter radiotolerans]MDX5895291.1 hypothetical protein [Rubrobacter radiotolerans]